MLAVAWLEDTSWKVASSNPGADKGFFICEMSATEI